MAKFCPECGKAVPENANNCPECGKSLSGNPTAQGAPIIVNVENKNSNMNGYAPYAPVNLKNKWVALSLCSYFGAIGVHKFYEGKIGMGVLYLFTLGLLGIGVFIDFIVLLFKPTNYQP